MMKAEKVVKTTNDLKDFMTKEVLTQEDILEMDPKTLRLLQLTNEFVNASNELILETEQMLNEINGKLDLLHLKMSGAN